MTNYYSILQIAPTASTDEIKKAINKELRIWSNRTNAPQIERRQEAERMVKLLGEAENILLDSKKRTEYDRQFKSAPKDERHIDDSELTGKDDVGLIKEAWRLLIAGNIADALYVATKATQSQGNNPEAWAVLAQAKFKWGETEDAIYEYKRAIQLKPNEASYYFDLGSVYESAERWNDALKQYQRAAQIDPQSTMYRAAIGILFIRNDMYKEGIEVLERCVAEEPDNSTYQWFLAMAYSERAYENWTYIPEGREIKSGYYATEKAHVEEAIDLIGKAERLRFDDHELLAHIKSCKENIHAMYERKFYGNWVVTIIWIIMGFILMSQSALGGLFFIGTASFYIFAARPPQFLLNRKIIKGQSPTGGFDGIIWVILFYPIMALWNFYKNHVEVGSLNTISSVGGDSTTARSFPIDTDDEAMEPIEAVPSYSADSDDSKSEKQYSANSANSGRPIEDVPSYSTDSDVAESETKDGTEAVHTGRRETTKTTRPTRPERSIPVQKNNAATLIACILGFILFVIVGYFAYDYLFVKQNFVGKIERALASGKYFAPPGDNVQDIYRSERTKSTDSPNLKKVADMITSKFEQEGNAAFQRFYNDSDDAGWDNIVKMYGFLTEIAPGNNEIQAKAEFAMAHNIIKGGRQNDYAQALSHYQKALELKPNWVFAINGIAKVYVRKNSPYYNRVEALNWYTRACEADPNFPWAYTNMAAIYSEDRQWDNAEQTLLKALALKRDRPSILIELGSLCEKQNRKPEAKNYYQEALKYEKNPEKTNWLQSKINSII